MELCRTFLLAPPMLSNCCYPAASSIQKVVKVTTRLIIHPNTCLKFTIFPHDDISDLKMHYVDGLAPPPHTYSTDANNPQVSILLV